MQSLSRMIHIECQRPGIHSLRHFSSKYLLSLKFFFVELLQILGHVFQPAGASFEFEQSQQVFI